MNFISPKLPCVIGLTGNTGGGKSSVAQIFREYGAVVIDADKIGRESYKKNPELKRKLVHEFGYLILDPEGQIDRKQLGAMVFSDPAKLQRLNELVGPFLWTEVQQKINEAKNQGATIIIVDAALIFEAGIQDWFDRIVVVFADEEICIERIIQRDHITQEQARQRIRAQWPVEYKKNTADDVIVNNGDELNLRRQTIELMKKYGLIEGYEKNSDVFFFQ